MGSSVILKRAFDKYGKSNFNKEVLFDFDTEDEALLTETDLVDEEFVARLDTYNIQLGGRGSWTHVNDDPDIKNWRQSGADVMAEKFKDSEYKEEHSNKIKRGHELYRQRAGDSAYTTWVGRRHTEESKRKVGMANSKHQKGKGNSQYGTCWIYSLTEKKSIKIKKENLQEHLDNGWLKGRRIKF